MKYSAENLEKMGFKLAMYSTAAVLAVQYALKEVYSTIRGCGHTEPMRSRMVTFPEYRALVDESMWTEFDNKLGISPSPSSENLSQLSTSPNVSSPVVSRKVFASYNASNSRSFSNMNVVFDEEPVHIGAQ